MILVQNGIMEISLLSVFCVKLDRLGLLNQAMILLAVYLLKVCSWIDRSCIKVDYIAANPGFPRLGPHLRASGLTYYSVRLRGGGSHPHRPLRPTNAT